MYEASARLKSGRMKSENEPVPDCVCNCRGGNGSDGSEESGWTTVPCWSRVSPGRGRRGFPEERSTELTLSSGAKSVSAPRGSFDVSNIVA